MNVLEIVGRCVWGVCVYVYECVVCSVTQGGIKMKPSKRFLMTTVPPSSHTLVVRPLPHTHHTMYTPGTHTTLSHHPHRQVLCCHLQTCPPTHFHTYIRAVCRTMGIHIAYRYRQDAHCRPAHMASARPCTCAHTSTFYTLSVTSQCSPHPPPLPGKGDRGNREEMISLSCPTP